MIPERPLQLRSGVLICRCARMELPEEVRLYIATTWAPGVPIMPLDSQRAVSFGAGRRTSDKE